MWRVLFGRLCVSGGWHFEGLAGWACVESDLFAGLWVAVCVVAAAMCEWQLSHLGAWGWVLCGGCRDVAGHGDSRVRTRIL